MIKIVIRILYWCTLIKPSLAVNASLTNITLIVKDYWSKFQRQKKSLKKGPSSRTLLANVGKQTPFAWVIRAKGPLAELVRGTQQYSSDPGFDSPWERISG